MKRQGPGTIPRCPASRRASSFLLPLVLSLGALAACDSYPRPVMGVPPGEPWFALPLQRWLAEDRGEPEALAICRRPECGPPMVVSVLRVTGPDADMAEAVLERPERLRAALEDMKGRKSKVRSVAQVRRIEDGAFQGFALSLGRADGERRPAHAAALGRRAGAGLRLVLVIGEDEGAVEAAVRRVAAQHLGT